MYIIYVFNYAGCFVIRVHYLHSIIPLKNWVEKSLAILLKEVIIYGNLLTSTYNIYL